MISCSSCSDIIGEPREVGALRGGRTRVSMEEVLAARPAAGLGGARSRAAMISSRTELLDEEEEESSVVGGAGGVGRPVIGSTLRRSPEEEEEEASSVAGLEMEMRGGGGRAKLKSKVERVAGAEKGVLGQDGPKSS